MVGVVHSLTQERKECPLMHPHHRRLNAAPILPPANDAAPAINIAVAYVERMRRLDLQRAEAELRKALAEAEEAELRLAATRRVIDSHAPSPVSTSRGGVS